jgi:hypothetical protein
LIQGSLVVLEGKVKEINVDCTISRLKEKYIFVPGLRNMA